MGLSREARIITLLVIDTAFFFIEIIIGYWVGSLALVADSFHMLNDIISLIVALYAIKLATSPSTSTNSYGWQRAEILGALINGVFLVALCVSIMLEAIKRFFQIEEVSNPMLVVIVGCLGLASNIVGLFLFHEHGHSHGGHSHSHGDEESHSHSHPTPPAIITTRPTDDETTALLRNTTSPSATSALGTSPSHNRQESFSSLYGHPAQTRAAVIETAAEFGYGRHETSGTSPSAGASGKRIALPEDAHTHDHAEGSHSHANGNGNGHSHAPANPEEKAEGGHGHGHSHGNMNMRGVFLHVLGDALGNVGVIAAGLVIWFVKARWALYFDPAVSLFITVIIFTSALPLVKSASYILLQGVPSHVSLEAVHKSITAVDGVVSVHELHVWQLSEKTVVASVHVLVAPGHDYMPVANGIREVMHFHGIHSVTIQPENVPADQIPAEEAADQACLIRCPPELCAADTCCPPAGKLVDVEEGDEGHSH